jgi:hypothetical protein
MKRSQCIPTNEGISNDTTSAAKGAMVWEISMWQTSKTNKLGSS